MVQEDGLDSERRGGDGDQCGRPGHAIVDRRFGRARIQCHSDSQLEQQWHTAGGSAV